MFFIGFFRLRLAQCLDRKLMAPSNDMGLAKGNPYLVAEHRVPELIPVLGQHQDVDRTPHGTEESIRMTEDRDKWRKYVHGVANSQIEDG